MFDPPYDPSTWLPYLEIGLELVRAVAWPIVVFLVFKYYSNEIRDLFPRLKRVGVGGAELDFGEQSKVRGPEADPHLSRIETQNLTDPIAVQFEERNFEELKNIPLENKESALVRALTITQVERAFALAYANIFGSQIQALSLLNGRSLSKKDGAAMLKDLQQQPVSFVDWDIDQFMRYLLTWRFVEEVDDFYSITETGRNFLSYLVRAGLSHERPN